MATVLFYDEFTGSSASDISGRTPDTNGTSWAKTQIFSASPVPVIGVNGSGKSNASTTSYGGGVEYKANCGTIPQNTCDIEFKITTAPGVYLSSTYQGAFGVWFRANGTGDSQRMGFLARGGGNYYLIQKRSSGAFTVNQLSSGVTTPQANDVILISITGADAFTVKKNGTTIITWQTTFTGEAMGAFSDVFLFAGEYDYRTTTTNSYTPDCFLEYFKITDTSASATYNKNLILGGGLI
jgi:hypothetical protein